MARDVISVFAGLLAGLGEDIAETLGDRAGRGALLARAGRVPPPTDPADTGATAAALKQVRESIESAEANEEVDPFQQLADLVTALVTLRSLIETAASATDEEDVWNLFATFFDVVALDRLRRRSPESVAWLNALHLVSDSRLQIAELVRSGSSWGNFLLGNPSDDDEKANNWSLILGASLVVVSALVPERDSAGDQWRTDTLFGWDPDPNSDRPRAERVLRRMSTIRITKEVADSAQRVSVSTVVVPPEDGGWGVYFGLGMGAGLTLPVGDHLELELSATNADAIEAFIGPDEFVRADVANPSAKIELRRKDTSAEPLKLGDAKKTHVELSRFVVGLEFRDPSRFRLSLGDLTLVIMKDVMGILGSTLPSERATFAFDLDLAIDSTGQFSFAGGAGLQVTIPVNKSIAALKVRGVTFALALEAGERAAVSLSATAAFGLEFGKAFKVAADGLGAKYIWALPASSAQAGAADNLGPAGSLGLAFVPPKGIGVAIDIGLVKGGGFLYFDAPNRTYAGVFEAELSLVRGIQIKAAGILRETDDGWDFIVILSAQFNPPFELFAGLTLNGVGGIVGINVGVDIDRLRAGLHDGAVGRLLFPDDPIGNAPAILSTMAAVFPSRPNGLVAGPMLQLGWGRPTPFVTASIAIVLVLPAPAQLLILGRLHILAPSTAIGVVDIKADFLGRIDFDTPSVEFDAAIVDSRVAAFAITGDMALRAGPGGFVLAVGGFHPGFDPPVPMPNLRRIRLDISPSSATKIQAECYLAVTSNTFQVGMHAALDIEAGQASIHGWLDFDALVVWEPQFHFIIEVDIGLELRVGGRTFAGISVDLLLEGPGPWHAKGRGSISFFFFSISARFEVTWGEAVAAPALPEIDAAARVAEALRTRGAWTAALPEGAAAVTLRSVTRDAVSVLPHGSLSARQQSVPIGVPIVRIGQSRVTGGSTTVTLDPIRERPPGNRDDG